MSKPKPKWLAEQRIVAAAHIVGVGDSLSWDPTTPAGELFEEALHHARAWRWAEAEAALDRLYALVGGQNEYTGYAFHVGAHPLQAYIRERGQE